MVESEMTEPEPSPASHAAASPGAIGFVRLHRTRLACFFSGKGGGFFQLRMVSCKLNPERCLVAMREERAELSGSSNATTSDEAEWGLYSDGFLTHEGSYII